MSLQVYNKTDPPISVIVYNSPATFIGRDPSLGALYKQHLSTGTKTLLNVLNHPDKCFDTMQYHICSISSRAMYTYLTLSYSRPD